MPKITIRPKKNGQIWGRTQFGKPRRLPSPVESKSVTWCLFKPLAVFLVVHILRRRFSWTHILAHFLINNLSFRPNEYLQLHGLVAVHPLHHPQHSSHNYTTNGQAGDKFCISVSGSAFLYVKPHYIQCKLAADCYV